MTSSEGGDERAHGLAMVVFVVVGLSLSGCQSNALQARMAAGEAPRMIDLFRGSAGAREAARDGHDGMGSVGNGHGHTAPHRHPHRYPHGEAEEGVEGERRAPVAPPEAPEVTVRVDGEDCRCQRPWRVMRSGEVATGRMRCRCAGNEDAGTRREARRRAQLAALAREDMGICRRWLFTWECRVDEALAAAEPERASPARSLRRGPRWRGGGRLARPAGETVTAPEWEAPQETAVVAAEPAREPVVEVVASTAAMGPEAGRRGGEDGALAYARSAGNELEQLFPRLPNPDVWIYVYPHLATALRVPVPGYTTAIPLFEGVHYALPGEIGEKE